MGKLVNKLASRIKCGSSLVMFLCLLLPASILGQETKYDSLSFVDYSIPRDYTIGGIEIEGVKFLDERILINMSGLNLGEEVKIPSDKLSKVIDKFWEKGLFSDVKLLINKIEGDKVFLTIYLQERPRLNNYELNGISKSDAEELRESLNLKRRSQVTDDVLNKIDLIISNYYKEKGFLNIEIDIKQIPDTNIVNTVNLEVDIDKNKKVKIEDIIFEGNEHFKSNKLRRKMKNTKKVNLNIFKASKYIETDYQEDKASLISFYNEEGYRDARIVNDSLYFSNEDPNRIYLEIDLEEGSKYYFRNIRWVGNTKYTSSYLQAKLGIQKGDVYDQSLLDKRLFIDEDAVTSLYLDNGYLFSSITPVEVLIENDSIDLEMRIYEGKQATIDKVVIKGNDRTNEHVIRREIRTMPGELFSRKDIIRTVRELAQLPYLNPEKINPNPIPDQENGTVDLEYQLEEKSSDQLEVSGGYGAGMLVGTIGLRFSNFSTRNLLNPKAWRPIPSGDGQTLSLRVQSNGRFYQGYNMTFVEPWFGGKKPNSLSVSLYHTRYNGNIYNRATSSTFGGSFLGGDYTPDNGLRVTGASVGFGARLKWPDDYFTVYSELAYQRYALNNYTNLPLLSPNATSNNINMKFTFGRNSVDQPIYPRRGSNFSFTVEATPPYSLLSNKDLSDVPVDEKYKWLEYHKYKIKTEYYLRLAGNLVLSTRAQFGFIHYYNEKIGHSPFETFNVGGSGLAGYSLYGRETIALRGYADGSLTPREYGQPILGNIYNKMTLELRFPFSLNPQATIYALAFVEGGDAWNNFEKYNPFIIKRAAGFGIRAFLPMFGMLGIDWAYGFDNIYDQATGQVIGGGKGEMHFIIGQEF